MVSSIELEGGMFKFPLASWEKNCIWAKIAFIYLFLKEFLTTMIMPILEMLEYSG